MDIRITTVLLLLMISTAPLRAQPDAPASPEMRSILAALQKGGHDLDVSSLPRLGREAAAAFDSKGLEIFQIPPPPGTADMFAYTIYYDEARGKYWVSRTGGFAGVRELYGPMAAPAPPVSNNPAK